MRKKKAHEVSFTQNLKFFLPYTIFGKGKD